MRYDLKCNYASALTVLPGLQLCVNNVTKDN